MRSFDFFPATKFDKYSIQRILQAHVWQLEGLYHTGLNAQKIDTGNTQVVFGKLFIYLINESKTEKFAYRILPGGIFKIKIENCHAIGRITDIERNHVRFMIDYDSEGYIVDLVR